MKKKIELRIIEVTAEIRALEDEYRQTFAIRTDYKVLVAVRETLVEVWSMFKKS